MAVIMGVAGVLTVLVGCGASAPTRSTEAFCDTLVREQDRILGQFGSDIAAVEATGDDLLMALGGLGASLSALSELSLYLDKLDRVAPPEIETDMHEVATLYRQQLESAEDVLDNPLSAVAGALFDSFRMARPAQRVHQFALDNCGRGL
jgi:hypothetical protein